MTELTPFHFHSSFPSFLRDYDFSPFTSLKRDYGWNPYGSLRQDVDRFFDEFLRMPAIPGQSYGHDRSASVWPVLDVRETDDEVIVTAELPGMTEKDIELYFDKSFLVIRGFKKTGKDEPGYSERYFGRFERHVPLAYPVDGQHCTAELVDGLLSIRFKKLVEVENKRKIPIVGHKVRSSSKVEAPAKSREPEFVRT